MPDLPPLPDGSDSSDGLEEENEAKRPRSTSTTPRTGSARGVEPFKYDRLMGVASVGPSSEGMEDREGTDDEANPQNGVTTDHTPIPDLYSGVGEGSSGMGSASLLKVLNSNRVVRLEIPAACVSQGAIEILRTVSAVHEDDRASSWFSGHTFRNFFSAARPGILASVSWCHFIDLLLVWMATVANLSIGSLFCLAILF